MSAAAPLLAVFSGDKDDEDPPSLLRRVLAESKKLWGVVGPAILQRSAIFSMFGVTTVFAGHLGDSELAAYSIAFTVNCGFSFGLLLGLASALETLCGQAFGAKRYGMLGVYLQRSWLVELAFATALLPVYIFTEPLLLALGQPEELSRAAARVSLWLIPLHFAMAMHFPMARYLQCQRKNWVPAVTALAALAFQVAITWVFVAVMGLGIRGTLLGAGVAWWTLVIGLQLYIACGGCPGTWTGLSTAAFADLWEFIKLSTASGVMLCVESWYYRVLVFATGYLRNAEIAVDALSICMAINYWEMMIPFAFYAGVGVRVANELGAGDGGAAKFATVVGTTTSLVIGVVLCTLIVAFDHAVALLFTTSTPVLAGVHDLSLFLGISILFNSVQPVLSGVAVGSGWQALVAYVNLASYYLVGVPLGLLLGWAVNLGVSGIWAGMIGGTAVQTAVVAYLTSTRDWDEEAKMAKARLRRWGD